MSNVHNNTASEKGLLEQVVGKYYDIEVIVKHQDADYTLTPCNLYNSKLKKIYACAVAKY